MTDTTSAAETVPSLNLARLRLMIWAVLMLSIYAAYVIIFPLIPYTLLGGPAKDIEIILRETNQHWFAPVYVIGLVVLSIAYWQTVRSVNELSLVDADAARRLRLLVIAAGLGFGITLLFLYPITAIDVFLYVVRGRLWTLYGASPMLALPENFATGDPTMAFAGEFANEPTPYGPLWTLVEQIPLQLGFTGMVGGTLGMKIIQLFAYLGSAYLLGWHAQPDHARFPVSRATMLIFFAWNPLVLMQAIGNGHNDMLMITLILLGLVLWQRDRWAWATFALTLAVTIKMSAILVLPLFGLAVLRAEPTWRGRLVKAAAMGAIILITALVLYRLTGPFPDVFEGVGIALFGRRGFAPASAVRMILREFYPRQWVEPLARSAARDLFVLYYVYLAIRLLRGQTTLISAAFMAYFAQLFLGATFRIWYPLWLIPFAALHLTSRNFWRTWWFGLTAELSIVSYFVLWRWLWRGWEWGKNGPLAAYWNYWTIMTVFTVPWTFGIPLVAPMILKARDQEKFTRMLWL